MEDGDLIWRAGPIQETLDSLEDVDGVDDYVLESIPDGPPDYPRYYVTRYLPDYFRADDDQTVFQVSLHDECPGKQQTLTHQPASYYESVDGCRRVSRAEAHEHLHGRYQWDQDEHQLNQSLEAGDPPEEKEEGVPDDGEDGSNGKRSDDAPSVSNYLEQVGWVGHTHQPFQVPAMNIIKSRAMGDNDFMIVYPTPTGPHSVSICGVGPFEVDQEEMKEHYISVEEEMESVRKEKVKEAKADNCRAKFCGAIERFVRSRDRSDLEWEVGHFDEGGYPPYIQLRASADNFFRCRDIVLSRFNQRQRWLNAVHDAQKEITADYRSALIEEVEERHAELNTDSEPDD